MTARKHPGGCRSGDTRRGVVGQILSFSGAGKCLGSVGPARLLLAQLDSLMDQGIGDYDHLDEDRKTVATIMQEHGKGQWLADFFGK